MSSEIAIRATGLGKCYHTYARPKDRLLQLFTSRPLYEEFWALDDVSFEAIRGETVGIVGRNGSGKSTLLQIVADTLTPTRGEIEVNGRVTALLELGAGFNPEFTGRENVYMNAAVLGLPRREIEARMGEILAFAEIGEFIDRPVKTYSSGMQVRLGFAVSVGLEPDVLIVDEALSVGDIEFQRKCFQKISDLKERETTILFVTHATEAIINHCDRALFLDRGSVLARGEPREVVNAYLTEVLGSRKIVGGERGRTLDLPPPPFPNVDPNVDACLTRESYNTSEYRWGDHRARIVDFDLRVDGEPRHTGCPAGGPCELEVVIHFAEAVERLVYGFLVRTVDGIQVFGSNSKLQEMDIRTPGPGTVRRVVFSFGADLVPGTYFVSIGIASEEPDGHVSAVDRRYDMVRLRIEGDDRAHGVALLDFGIEERPPIPPHPDKKGSEPKYSVEEPDRRI